MPPGYDGPLPEGGFFTAHARTTRVLWFGRMFLEDNSPKPAAETIRKFIKIYRYEAGGVGTSFAAFLSGKVRLGAITPPPETVFHEGSGRAINTIPPNDFSFYEMLDEVVQQEPAELAGPRTDGPDRRDRHRQGQTLCARCPDEEDPHRGGRGGQCHRTQSRS